MIPVIKLTGPSVTLRLSVVPLAMTHGRDVYTVTLVNVEDKTNVRITSAVSYDTACESLNAVSVSFASLGYSVEDETEMTNAG